MSLTQKYKQQQQQVRVLTNESNYLNGMYFTDTPLAEGFSRVLINFDIDSLSGKLTPRKGLKSLGLIRPSESSRVHLDNTQGFNIVAKSKICSVSDSDSSSNISKYLQAVLYNTELRSLLVATSLPEISDGGEFTVTPFTKNSEQEYAAPIPFVIDSPGIHGKACIHKKFFEKPVGTFAFGDSFYTFLEHSYYYAEKIADLPNENYVTNTTPSTVIQDYDDLKNHSIYATGGRPGQYFEFTEGESVSAIAYYDSEGNLQLWERDYETLVATKFAVDERVLCYTRLGKDIKLDSEIELLDKSLDRTTLVDNQYYVCKITSKQLNPTEASTWGYNMLLKNPYDFVCENTAVNLVSITGILPYGKDNKIILTPRKNQEITLKGFYRAPSKYHSDVQNARFYTTTQKKVLAPNEDKPRDPRNFAELSQLITAPYADYNWGDWWYCSDSKEYYMIVTKDVNSTLTKSLELFGTTKPAASVKLNGVATNVENPIRVRWQMRSAGAATWTDLYNEQFNLSDYYARQGDHAPFTITLTIPDNEILIKLTITDPTEPAVDGEEFVLSTNTIGLSAVSDELANTLNLDAKVFDLSKCTGMCEWEQRLVVWGVPNALNTLFVSDVNNPGFFPYPNNVDIFTDPIIAVHNFGNELLVLTTSALYRLSWDSEGTGWTHKLVQQNLHVTEEDTFMSCVIKNMFFFKSGEYFYMMVPRTSVRSGVQGDTTIAPISKPVNNLLDNFHEEVYNLIRVISDTPDLSDFTDRLVNYFSYVDNTKVVVNYVYSLDESVNANTTTEDMLNSKYLYIQLIYDTDTRTWAMRAFESAHMMYASHADALQQDRFIDLTPAATLDKLALQYYKFDGIADNVVQYIDSEDNEVPAVAIIKNYQYLDTGNREINTELKKRFREFQFKLKNKTSTNLGFYTSFLIDGSVCKDLQRYQPRYISGERPDEGMLIVERVLDTTTMTYRTSRIERVLVPARMLQDEGELAPTILNEPEDADQWILNQSAFPGRTFWKIRMPIAGKGYSPRVILLSTNEKEYEIMGHSWAYRTMHAR